LIPTSFWAGGNPVIVGFAALFLGDFIGYWRHRLEHSPLLWPSHAVHHSDTEMTWLAIARFHPINRLTTVAIDAAFILWMGLPPYAVLVNSLVRHYYGAFIHADLPWTYGWLAKAIVSPAMHRWHHAKDRQAYNTNYATVFSLFDLAFGTYRVPGPCNGPLGVPEAIGAGFVGQMVHPLKPSSYRYFLRSIGFRRSKA
jgi:sterol desaturase/sphingolipid hydroxylase (fatty acid hydroxylase superfamily)